MLKPSEWVAPQVSVLVTVSERPVDLRRIYEVHAEVLRQAGLEFEFIFAAEPWHASSLEPLAHLQSRGEPIRILEVAQGMGEATLLRVAASRVRGKVLLTVPPYWRVEPSVLPAMIERVEAGADLVVARRWPRSDSWINRVQNRVFHGLVHRTSGSGLRDLACGVRAFRADILEEVPLYGDFHRFFPLLVDRAGFRVEEIDAPQHPEDMQSRVYSPGVYLRRVLDLLGVYFLLRFMKKPLRFFGLFGSGLSVMGGSLLLVVLIQRLGGEGIADRPMLLLGTLLLALGVQAIALGLIGEIIVFLHAPDQPPYREARDFRSAAAPERPEGTADARSALAPAQATPGVAAVVGAGPGGQRSG